MPLLKKLLTVLGLVVAGFVGGGLVGFTLGYVIAGDERSNPHGGLVFVALLMFAGAILGLIVGAVTAYRISRRVT